MVNRFVEKDRHQVVGGDARIRPDDAVAGGDMKPFHRSEGENVCRDVFAAVVLTVLGAIGIGDPVRPGRVNNHRGEPSVNPGHLTPFYRLEMKPDMHE